MDDILIHVRSLLGIPYKFNPPYSIEEGFNCFSWVAYFYGLAYQHNYVLETNFSDLRLLRKDFVPIKDTPKRFDIAVFDTVNTIGTLHIGSMLDSKMMTHCSINTNGVSIVDITKKPWSIFLKAIYRHI